MTKDERERVLKIIEMAIFNAHDLDMLDEHYAHAIMRALEKNGARIVFDETTEINLAEFV